MGLLRSSPKSSPKKKSSLTLQNLFDLDFPRNGARKLSRNNSSPKKDSFDPDAEEIFSLVSHCSFIYSFTDPKESPSQQDLKRLKLIQLLSIIKSLKTPLSTGILSSLFVMLSANLCRPLPPSTTSIICVLPDDEEFVAAPAAAWPHLQIAYDILLRLLVKIEPKVLCNYIDHPFLLNLLTLFRSEDPRERESLKNIYHQIYSKFTFYRSFMRKSMNDVFLHFIFETDHRHCGIGDLLEIWGSIINGFTVPLKEEHRLFLMRVLIPLHKPKGMMAYHRQLAYCVSQFVQKEPLLGGFVVRGILRYWPVTNCQKEVLLIGELEDLVEIIDPHHYSSVALPLCTQITKCLNSWNSQVAERALYVWNREEFVKMASEAVEDVFPILVEGMEKNLKYHWSKSVKQLTQNVKEMLEKVDPGAYLKCLSQLQLKESVASRQEMRRKEMWERLEMAATRNEPASLYIRF